ncbi:DUF6354 family protein [Streptomyces sp. NBC_01233]|uniref:DUF6354 family protein n=1 Tax=Streptomyces sp. NBC_01233 TaxID=2903787 RepID=UPI003FA3B557
MPASPARPPTPVWFVCGPPPSLAAISEVHRRDATPTDYAHAALRAVREISQ